MAQKARAKGYEWLALEIDDYGNLPRWPDFRDHCYAHGLVPGVWVTDGWNLPMTPPDAKFTIAEIESEGDYQGVIASPVPPMPHAIVTNFSPMDASVLGLEGARERARPLIERGYFCQTECYIGDNPHATPDRMHARATQLGWGSSQPAFGVYNAPLSAYEQWMGWPGCDYVAENVI